MNADQYRPGSNVDFDAAVVKLGQPKILDSTGSIAYCDARQCCVNVTIRHLPNQIHNLLQFMSSC